MPAQTPKTYSVIIPCFNEAHMIEGCLKSLLSQTRPPDEIIVVDNNCTDATADIARRNGARVVFEPQQGIVFARNRGIAESSGDVVIKLDADTQLTPNFVSSVAHAIEVESADAYSCYVSSRDANVLFAPLSEFAFNHMAFGLLPIIIRHKFLLGSNMAVTRKAWDTISQGLQMRNDIWEDLDVAEALDAEKFTMIVEKKKLASISSRSVNVTIAGFYRRMTGAARALRLRSPVSAKFAYLFALIATGLFIVLKPPSTIGKQIGVRSRPEQM